MVYDREVEYSQIAYQRKRHRLGGCAVTLSPCLDGSSSGGQRENPQAVTVRYVQWSVRADEVRFNAKGQIQLGKMTAAAVEKSYKAKT